MIKLHNNKRWCAAVLCIASALPAAAAKAPPAASSLADLKRREAAFDLYRQHYLSAISRLSTQAADDPWVALNLATLYEAWGLPQAAVEQLERAARQGERIPARSWLSLAWNRYFERDLGAARGALHHLKDLPRGNDRAERDFLRGLLMLGSGRYGDAAKAFQAVGGQGAWSELARYNLALARLGAGRQEQGLTLLESLAPGASSALADYHGPLNAALGYRLLRAGQPDSAASWLAQVGRGETRYRAAQLALGWTAFRQRDYDAALKHWDSLTTGNAFDAVTHEALLGSARARYESGAFDQAVSQYRRALDSLAATDKTLLELGTDAALADYIQALLAANPGAEEAGRYWKVERLPPGPPSILAVNTLLDPVFQAALGSYRDTQYLIRSLETWGGDLVAYRDLAEARQADYWDRAPRAMARARTLDEAGFAQTVKRYKRALARAQASEDVAALATSEQMQTMSLLERVEIRLARLKGYIVDHEELAQKYEFLRGRFIWQLHQQFPERVAQTRAAIEELEKALAEAGRNQARLQRSAQAATRGFKGFDKNFSRLKARQDALLERARDLAEEQLDYLVTRLRQTLNKQRERTRQRLAQAQLGLAQSLDRQAQNAGDKADYNPAIAAYEAFLAYPGDSTLKNATRRRIADLAMIRAEFRFNRFLDKSSPNTTAAFVIYEPVTAKYERLLQTLPDSPGNDRVLYQLAKAHDRGGELEKSLAALTRLTRDYPDSGYHDEAQFRRGELLFTFNLPKQAAEAYGAVVVRGPESAYYEKSLYKHGWALYKANHLEAALQSFMVMLDAKLGEGQEALDEGDRELVSDVLRVSSLSLAQLGGVSVLERLFEKLGPRPYEHRLYTDLAALYLKQERIEDAAETYRAFVERHPNHPQAPAVAARVIATYHEGGVFTARELDAKKLYVQHYAPTSPYWAANPAADSAPVFEQVKVYLDELGRYAHARAQRDGTAQDFADGEHWYRLFLDAFPDAPEAAAKRFLLAELLFEAGKFDEAAGEYLKVAYDYPAHEHSKEAAYAALLAFQRQTEQAAPPEAQNGWREKALAAAARFTAAYPGDPRTPTVLARAAEDLWTLKRAEDAARTATTLVQQHPDADPELRRSGWTVLGHVQFDSGRYAEAEHSYRQALRLLAPHSVDEAALRQRLAAAIYQQGAAAEQAGELRAAVQHFERASQAAPGTEIATTAQFDAATALLTLEDWPAAITALKAFRKAHPGHALSREIPIKLALALQKTGAVREAAAELAAWSSQAEDAGEGREALLQAAELYFQAGELKAARNVYRDYVKRYPSPLLDAIEARWRLADIYQELGDMGRRNIWLRRIRKANRNGGEERSPRTILLAARAAYQLAEFARSEFEKVELVHPLEKNLKRKTKKMEAALTAYRRAVEYGVAEVTTASTYRIGQIYSDFSHDLLNSERPRDLDATELEQYNVLLEEQAYPFEEQAISLFESNARRTAEDIYDEWVRKSFAQLKKLLPARYAKQELGEAFIDDIY
ncbi:MAG TPA: tetratricopeptide repeat protein [Gammaproteobacteria bacterium]|nr:tetratricopeptide repeat protein [Gammaproteobacteria bacterium]